MAIRSHVVASLVLLAGAGCGSAPGPQSAGGGSAAGGSGATGGGGNGDTGAGGGSSAGGGGNVTYAPDGGVNSGLPCDVQQLLQNTCWSCHGVDYSLSAPANLRLVTWEDLTSQSATVPSQTNAQRALTRMQATVSAMPPLPNAPATTAQLATMQSWVEQGTLKGSCVVITDGGSPLPPADAGAPVTDPLLNAAPVCTSGISWFLGDLKSSLMNPGKPCIACHVMKPSAPQFAAAGTVYPTGHEPDLCGAKLPSGVTVVITGADGHVFTVTPNADGNFSQLPPLALPYTAKVKLGTKERAMVAAQTVGDCNSCHTQSGTNSAPGRITVPY